MKELSLYTGAGGGVYGSKLLNWKTIGYVEFNEYCQKVIAQRIEDGIFDKAPVFTDVREFVKSGAAKAYRGFVDVVSGGFPCQPFSVAGKREASNDERDMWPATMDIIKAVKPPYVFLENVPGLLSATVDNTSDGHIHYFGTILRDLAESGYDVKWCCLGADDVGAPHKRQRLWILGHAKSVGRDGRGGSKKEGLRSSKGAIEGAGFLADSSGERSPVGLARQKSRKEGFADIFDNRSNDCGRQKEQGELGWWLTEPALGRVANGVADRGNRLKAIGNGQVSICMATAYAILSAEFAK